jgi:hypothetical protein
MAVSDVGRIAMCSSRSDWPLDPEGQSKHDIRQTIDARSCDPSDLRGETLDVVLLPFEHFL